MEIYKLSDFSENGKKNFVITDLKQGVKNPDRVNVFVDSKFSFSLDVAQVVDLKIKIGRKITEEELAELQQASEFGKLYQKTLEWVLMRPRSEKETRDYIFKKVFEKKLDKDYVDEIINKLKNKKYLDDYKFSEFWVENRFVKRGISKKRLQMELMKKGVALEIINEVLNGRDDEEEIDKIIAKKRAKYDDDKLIAYLCRQGFPFELARSRVQSCETDLQSLE